MHSTPESVLKQFDLAFKQGAINKALDLLRTLCQLCPEDPEAHHKLGVMEKNKSPSLSCSEPTASQTP